MMFFWFQLHVFGFFVVFLEVLFVFVCIVKVTGENVADHRLVVDVFCVASIYNIVFCDWHILFQNEPVI